MPAAAWKTGGEVANVRVVIEGATRLDGSYGQVNVYLAAALARAGLEVTLSPWDQDVKSCRAQLRRESVAVPPSLAISSDERLAPEVRVRMIWPPVWTRPADGSHLVVAQPWEFGSVPVQWLAGIAAADAVLVPTSYVKKGYVQSGVGPGKVWVVPIGTDLDRPPLASRRAARCDGDPLQLLFVGGGIYRKGVDLLVAALDALDDATLARLRLTIKETGSSSYYQGQSLVETSLAAASRVAARTSVRTEHLARPELAALFDSAHVLVHPYRSEGFALPVLEAMASGLPVLVTKGGATDDFCGPGEAIHIDAELALGESPFVGDLLTVDRPYHLTPDKDQLSERIAALASGELDPWLCVEAAYARSRQLSWDAVACRTIASLEAIVAGRPPSDAFSDARDAVRHLVEEPAGAAWTRAAGSLLALGDLHGARRAADLAAARGSSSPELTTMSRRLAAAATSSPDTWSAAPWRLDLAAALRERADVPAVVHQHEGDAAAVTAIAAAIAPYFSTCRRVLDLGCGLGAMLRRLRSEGKQVVGLEGDPRLVAALRDEAFEVVQGWIPADLELLEDERFDGVFMGHIVEHLTTEQTLEVLGWVAEHLEDDGTLVIQTPDFSQPFVSATNFWLDPTHVRPYPLPLLSALLESAGFAPLAGACRPLGPAAPLDVLAVGRIRRAPATPATPAASRRGPCVVHVGLFGSTSGVGHASRTLLDPARLAEVGIDLLRLDVELSPDAPLDGATLPFADALAVRADVAVIDVPIGWLPEVLPRVRARRRVVRLAYEASPLPRYLAEALAAVDEIWPMSRYVEEAVRESGLEVPMLLVTPRLAPTPAAEAGFAGRGRGTRPTVLSSVFSLEPRKNPEALLGAVLAVLEKGHDLELVVKTSGIDEDGFWAWAGAVLGDGASAVRRSCQLVTSHLSDEEVRDLVACSDAFVLPTRGEGFGLPFLEAMSVGVPSVCPDVGGHRDFCDEETSFLVPTTSVPCAASWGIPLFRESRWREVERDALISAIERVITEPEVVVKKAAASLERARDLAEAAGDGVAERRLAELAADTSPARC